MFIFGEPFHKYFLCISLVHPLDSLVLFSVLQCLIIILLVWKKSWKNYSYHILNLESDIAFPLIKTRMVVLESDKDIYSDFENLLESDFFFSLNFGIKIHTDSLSFSRIYRQPASWIQKVIQGTVEVLVNTACDNDILADWALDKIVSRWELNQHRLPEVLPPINIASSFSAWNLYTSKDKWAETAGANDITQYSVKEARLTFCFLITLGVINPCEWLHDMLTPWQFQRAQGDLVVVALSTSSSCYMWNQNLALLH